MKKGKTFSKKLCSSIRWTLLGEKKMNYKTKSFYWIFIILISFLSSSVSLSHSPTHSHTHTHTHYHKTLTHSLSLSLSLSLTHSHTHTLSLSLSLSLSWQGLGFCYFSINSNTAAEKALLRARDLAPCDSMVICLLGKYIRSYDVIVCFALERLDII